MARLWLHLMAVVMIALPGAMTFVEGKRSRVFDNLTSFEAAALDMPTCCPASPKLYCDFFFDGYEHSIPIYHVSDGVNMDHPLSPSLAKTLGWMGLLGRFSPGVKDNKTKDFVVVSSTYKNGTFLQCPDAPDSVGPSNQFYVTGTLESPVGKLHAKAFQRPSAHQHGRRYFQNRCVLLPLTSLQITTGEGNINLDFGDGQEDYPEKRRCVVFRTAK